MASMTIKEALEKWQVIAPGQWENEDGPEDWWAVENDNGIVFHSTFVGGVGLPMVSSTAPSANIPVRGRRSYWRRAAPR
jgi:hypothetical protein